MLRAVCCGIQGVVLLGSFVLASAQLTSVMGMSGVFRWIVTVVLSVAPVAFLPLMWELHDKIAGRESEPAVSAWGRPKKGG